MQEKNWKMLFLLKDYKGLNERVLKVLHLPYTLCSYFDFINSYTSMVGMYSNLQKDVTEFRTMQRLSQILFVFRFTETYNLTKSV